MNDTLVPNITVRNKIRDFEDALKSIDGHFEGDSVICPLKHTFAPFVYVREIFIPANTYLTGKIHRHEHANILVQGTVEIITEFSDNPEILTAPCTMVSKAGTKRALHTLTDCIWVTVHPNPTNTTDLEKLENQIIAKSYKELQTGNSLFHKIKKLIKL